MNKDPLVSIVINNYNYARYLPDCINSALNQTHANIEVIVVDDGSSDDSKMLLRAFGDKIKPVFKKNGGQGSALNEGFNRCHGEIICLLDSDDIFFSHKVESIIREFQKHPNAEFLIHRLNRINENGAPLNLNESKDHSLLLNKSGDYRHQSRYKKMNFVLPATTALVFKKSLVKKILPVPSELRVTADNYLKYAGLINSPIIVCDQFLSAQRIHGKNLWTNKPANAEKRKLFRDINYHIAKGVWNIDKKQTLSYRLLFGVFKSSIKDLDIIMILKSTIEAVKFFKSAFIRYKNIANSD